MHEACIFWSRATPLLVGKVINMMNVKQASIPEK